HVESGAARARVEHDSFHAEGCIRADGQDVATLAFGKVPVLQRLTIASDQLLESTLDQAPLGTERTAHAPELGGSVIVDAPFVIDLRPNTMQDRAQPLVDDE